MNIQQWLRDAIYKLQQQNPRENAKIDAQILVEFVTQKSRAHLLAFADDILSPNQLQILNQLLQRRLQGEPIAYILGETDFWTLNLEVSPDTLIPRSDTEILVEQVLAHLPPKNEVAILDLGTGTGAIALAIASELKQKRGEFSARILGVDLLQNVVELAKRNGMRNQLPDVEFRQSSWFDNIYEKFDVIVSNPPYIDPKDNHLNQGDVRFEPLSALISDEQGYADLRQIIEQAPNYLQPQGWLLLEHGWQQAEKVRSFFSTNLWQHVATVKDYGDNERVTLAQFIG